MEPKDPKDESQPAEPKHWIPQVGEQYCQINSDFGQNLSEQIEQEQGGVQILSLSSSQGDDDECFVRYNPKDSEFHDKRTTSLVVIRTGTPYILYGDHRDAYRELLLQGSPACFTYFLSQFQSKGAFFGARRRLNEGEEIDVD